MRGEVPYITTAQVQSAKGEKWSDGAVGWHGEHVGALIEAKALVAHTASKVCKDIRDKVAPDLAAMLGIDRGATLSRQPGTYEDPEWSTRRTQLQRLYALQFVLVHGVETRSCRELLSDALAQGVTRVVTRYVAQQPTWLSALQRAYVDEPLFQAEAGEGASSGLLTAWTVPLPWLE